PRPSPLRTGQRSQAEIRDRLCHRIGAHVTFRVEPPGAPVAHPNDRECGKVSIGSGEPTDINAALDPHDEMVQPRPPRRLRSIALRFRETALAAFDDTE